MPIDGYMAFEFNPNQQGVKDMGKYLKSEASVDVSEDKSVLMSQDFLKIKEAAAQQGLFEIEDYGFGVSRNTSTGSQSSGVGTGTVEFESFTVNRNVDCASPTLFWMSCSGATFPKVSLVLRKGAGDGSTGSAFLRFNFKLVSIKNIAYGNGDPAPTEALTLDYGALQIHYVRQNPDGSMMNTALSGGWNRITNKVDLGTEAITARV